MSYRLPDGGPVRVRATNTSGAIPTAAELEEGELALNAADGSIYYQTAAGGVASFAAGFQEPPIDGNTYGRKDGAWVDLASAAALQFRQGTNADRLVMDPVPASGEPIYTTDTKRLFIGDGTTVGGNGLVGNSPYYVICQPGDDLIAKYDEACAISPAAYLNFPAGRSNTNRVSLIIYPGVYVINSNWDIDTDYVDIIGLGATRWKGSVDIRSSGVSVNVLANNVYVQGLQANRITLGPGGDYGLDANYELTGRVLYNCSASATIGGPNESVSPPIVVGGLLVGCAAISSIGNPGYGNLGGLGGSPNPQISTCVFVDCFASNRFCQRMVFQGQAKHCTFNSVYQLNGTPGDWSNGGYPFFAYWGLVQGKFQHCEFASLGTAELAARSSFASVVPAGFNAAVSIAEGGTMTSASHGLYDGTRVQFTTTGTLPTGLTTAGMYYVRDKTDNTFAVSATRNGTAISTTGGSGTHTLAIPAGVAGGWYSYCVTKDGQFTST